MGAMRRILKFGGVLLVVLAGAVLALPFIIPHDFIAGQLKAAVKAATGRTLSIGEAPKLVFWPDFAVTLKDVRLSNPPGLFEGQVAQMDELRIRVEVRSLFHRVLDIKELHLIRPQLSLVIDGEGRPNWTMSKDEAPQEGGVGSPGLETGSVAPITIEDGDVRFLDERSGKVFMANNVDMTVTVGSLTGPVAVKGSLTALGDEIALAFSVKKPAVLARTGSPINLTVKSQRLAFAFSGQALMRDGLILDGTIKAETGSVRDLAAWAKIDVPDGPGFGPAKFNGQLAFTPKGIKLSKARVSLDGLMAMGDLSLALAARPFVTANLGFDVIDVNRYLAPRPEAPAPAAGWSGALISFAGLGGIDGKLRLSANSLVYRDLKTGKITIDATVKNGQLDAALNQVSLYGGTAQGRLFLDGAGKVPALQASLDAKGFDGLRLLRDYAGLERFEGTAGASVNLAAKGRSQLELISSLRGTGEFRLASGAIRGIDIEAMVKGVANNILTGWYQGPDARTPFDLLSASFTVNNGIAATNTLNFTSPVMSVKGGGIIDLPHQALNLKVSPTLTLAEAEGLDLAGLAVPIIIKGPWAAPRIYPDIAGILENPEAAYDMLRKLVGEGTTASLKEKGQMIQQQVKDKLSDEIGKALGDDAAGQETSEIIDDQAQKVLKGLLGNGE
jgi:AsmA protein